MNDAAKRVTFFLALTGAFALGLLLRLPAFAPSGLWLDDQWIAVLVRDASLSDMIALAPPVPPGFVLMLKSLVAVCGSSPASLQALPMLAGTLLVPATAVLALRTTGSRAVAAMAALFVAADPTLVTYSARVKPFTLDALATVLIACAFVEAVRRPSVRTIRILALAAVASLGFSYAAALSGAAFLHVAVVGGLYVTLRRRITDATLPLLGGVLVACIAFDFVVVLIFSVILHGHTDASVFARWQKYYLPLGNIADTWRFLATKGLIVFNGTLPGAPSKLAAALAAIGLLRLMVDRRTASVALGIAAVFAALFVASALGRYPVGGARTDLFTHPLSALLVAIAVYRLAGALPGATFARPMSLAAMSIAVLTASVPGEYPAAGDREVVEHAAATVVSTDTVIIYPWSSWAVALYTGWPVHLRPEPASTNGFYAVPDRPRTLLLGEVVDGASFRWSPTVAPAEIDELLGDTSPQRVQLIATRTEEAALGYIRAAFEARGYVRVSSHGHDRATLDVFEHRPEYGIDFIGARQRP